MIIQGLGLSRIKLRFLARFSICSLIILCLPWNTRGGSVELLEGFNSDTLWSIGSETLLLNKVYLSSFLSFELAMSVSIVGINLKSGSLTPDILVFTLFYVLFLNETPARELLNEDDFELISDCLVRSSCIYLFF